LVPASLRIAKSRTSNPAFAKQSDGEGTGE
jgi:hypothetical protein